MLQLHSFALHCLHLHLHFGGVFGMVVGLVGLFDLGAKSESVVLGSRALTGLDPATTEPCPVPFGTLFALPALELHLACMFASH